MARNAILAQDDGEPKHWQRGWKTALALIAALAAAAVAPDTQGLTRADIPFVTALLGLITAPLAYWLLRPRIDLTRESLTVRGLFRTHVVQLADVLDATSDYHGVTIDLAGNLGSSDGYSISSNLLGTANITRWLGRTSKSDIACALITMRANAARGGAGAGSG